MNKYQNINFNDTNLYIGIDVHKKNWEVAVRSNGIQLKGFNMEVSVNHLSAAANPALTLKFNQLAKPCPDKMPLYGLLKSC